MKYKVEIIRIRDHTLSLSGWAVGRTPESKFSFSVETKDHKSVDIRIASIRRDAVSQHFFGRAYDSDLGFDIQFPYQQGETYYLKIAADGKRSRFKLNEEVIARRKSAAYRRWEWVKGLANRDTVRAAVGLVREHGLKALYLKSKHRLTDIQETCEYNEWYEMTKPTLADLEKQRQTAFLYEPKISIVIPAYQTPEKYLKELLDSVLAQTYENWEMCIADGSGKSAPSPILSRYAANDKRIKYCILGKNLGISGNTNAALEMATGDFIALADHDDTLTAGALYECVAVINQDENIDVLYSDEDKMSMAGGSLFDPHFKPDFNIDLLRSVNYICHLFVFSREILEKVGPFREEFDGAQDYDFIFRCTEAAFRIYHIPKVLYHWRCHENSTASNPKSKLYAFEAGARAIEAHYQRVGIDAVVEKGVDYGIYHTHYQLKDTPLVSVIIPNKDHTEDLNICISSLKNKATYQNLEFIIIENNSTDKRTFEYYQQLEAAHKEVRVVRWDREFNYSAINNYGAGFAKGEYLLLMNNDTEVISENVIEELLGYCMREDVGIVGTRLLYQDDTIQHAGVVVGFGGIAGHTFIGLHKGENSYFQRAMCAQNYSAVTAACMMTKKSVFDAVGGFSEDLAIAFNDIDYCMKVRNQGKLVVYNPYAELYHYESKSRGLENTPEKVARFNREIETFRKKWPDILKNGDPYYNPNLTLNKSNFDLRDLKKEERP